MANGRISPGAIFEAARQVSGGALSSGFRQGLAIDANLQAGILADQQLQRQRKNDQARNAINTVGILLNPKTLKTFSRKTQADRINRANSILRSNGFDIGPDISETDLEDKKLVNLMSEFQAKFSGLTELNRTGGLSDSEFDRESTSLVNEVNIGRNALGQGPFQLERQPAQGRFKAAGGFIFDESTGQFIQPPQEQPTSLQRLSDVEQARAEGRALGAPPQQQRQLTPNQVEQQRIFNKPPGQRTEEEKRFIGTSAPQKKGDRSELSLRKRLSQIAKDKESISRGGVSPALRKRLGERNAELLTAFKGGAKNPAFVKAALDALNQEEQAINAILNKADQRSTVTGQTTRSITGDDEFDNFFTGQ